MGGEEEGRRMRERRMRKGKRGKGRRRRRGRRGKKRGRRVWRRVYSGEICSGPRLSGIPPFPYSRSELIWCHNPQ